MRFPLPALPKSLTILSLDFVRWGIVFWGCASLPEGVSAQADAIASPAQASLLDRGWQRCQPLQEGAVFAGTVAGSDGRIYVISGSTGESGQLTSRNSAFDPRKNSWTQLAPIPTPRSEPGAALGPDGKIYIVGGNPTRNRKQSSKMNVVEVYNPKTDRWATAKPLPTPRTALCAVAARNASRHVLIYAMGGRNFDMPGNGLSTVEAYDPLTDTWTAMSSMPINLHAMTATAGPDGRIYVLGGTNSKIGDINTMQVYEPATDRWARGTPALYGQECACSTFTSGQNGEILVLGGWGDPRKIPLASVAAYNPRTDTWRSLPRLITATAAAGAATIESPNGDTHICVIGGLPDSTSVQEYSF
jgi:N-acetylneuraminic acid mutarotase